MAVVPDLKWTINETQGSKIASITLPRTIFKSYGIQSILYHIIKSFCIQHLHNLGLRTWILWDNNESNFKKGEGKEVSFT